MILIVQIGKADNTAGSDFQHTGSISKEIRAVQKDLSKKEIGRIFNEEKVTDERFEELMKNYIEEDKYHQYLVDGAVLRCTAATTDDFTYAEEETVVLENKDDEVCNITLDVHENPMNINGLTYATIKDTIQNVNIVAPKCNCCLAADRDAERNSIKDDTDRNKNGVCMHLMRLNEEWDNFEVDGTTYLTKTNIAQSPFTAGAGKILDVVIEKSEGITMTSVLFCKHGGLIMPVTSGQIITSKEDAINVLYNYLSIGEFEEDEVEEALAYLAGLSKYKLLEYKSNLGYDYNEYDIYILGWTEYYNEMFDLEIDPKYIKAQCYRESRIGKGPEEVPAANVKKDIMQALDVRNGNIYEYIGISLDNFRIKTSTGDYKTGSEVWILNYGSAKQPEADVYDKDKKARCGGIINTLFNTKKDGTGICYDEESSGMYYYQLETVTPIMSIGLGLDKMQELLKKYSGNYYEALKEYNNSTKKEEYANEIIIWAETEGNYLQME